MLIAFLTFKEREYYQKIPKMIEEETLLQFFFLNQEDMVFIESLSWKLE